MVFSLQVIFHKWSLKLRSLVHVGLVSELFSMGWYSCNFRVVCIVLGLAIHFLSSTWFVIFWGSELWKCLILYLLGCGRDEVRQQYCFCRCYFYVAVGSWNFISSSFACGWICLMDISSCWPGTELDFFLKTLLNAWMVQQIGPAKINGKIMLTSNLLKGWLNKAFKLCNWWLFLTRRVFKGGS